MVAMMVRVVAARVILLEMAPSVGTVGAVTPPLVRSCRGDNAVDVQEPDVVESSVEVLSCFQQGLTGSSGKLKQRLRW
jgi:hypothetical protein